MKGVLDTSVFIAREQGRRLATDRLPDEAAISIVTVAGLELGVHLAESESTRGRRLQTLGAVRAAYAALPIDESVASAFAELVAAARRVGRRPRIQDAWIAATARAHGVAVYSQDADSDGIPGVEIILV